MWNVPVTPARFSSRAHTRVRQLWYSIGLPSAPGSTSSPGVRRRCSPSCRTSSLSSWMRRRLFVVVSSDQENISWRLLLPEVKALIRALEECGVGSGSPRIEIEHFRSAEFVTAANAAHEALKAKKQRGERYQTREKFDSLAPWSIKL